MTALNEALNLSALFPPHDFSDWQRLIAQELKGIPFEKLRHLNEDGLTIEPLYRTCDLPTDLEQTPGTGLHRRGDGAAGYLHTPWQVCQSLALPQPAVWNQAAQADLAHGLDALWVPLNTLESDTGLILETVADLQRAFAGLDFSQTPLYVRMQAPALAPAALFLGYWEAEGTDPAAFQGGLLEDPLADRAVAGQLAAPLGDILTRSAWLIQELSQCAPQLKTLALDGFRWHQAGASASQELACLLSSALYYLRELDRRGVAPEVLIPRLHWTLSAGADFLVELAKFRALRMLWQRLLQASGLSGHLWLHGRTSERQLSRIDPYTNMLRVTTSAFCAVLGGVNSLQTSCFNQPLGLPDAFSRRQARNLQLLLREESNLSRLIDPVGGSFALEALTTQLAERAWDLFQQLEAAGGMASALNQEVPQRWIAESCRQRREALDRRKTTLVGTSQYAPLSAETRLHTCSFPSAPVITPPQTPAWHPEKFAPEKTDFGAELRLSARHGIDWPTLQSVLLQDPAAPDPVLPPLPVFRAAEPFERLRARVEALPEPPQIQLVTIGPVKSWQARVDFVRGFLEVAGLRVELAETAADMTEASARLSRCSASGAVLCAADDLYPEAVPALLRAAHGPPLWLAGYPAEQAAHYQAEGLVGFIHLKADLLATLNTMLDRLGVPA
jgi:methylmalonyl-CoA mutase